MHTCQHYLFGVNLPILVKVSTTPNAFRGTCHHFQNIYQFVIDWNSGTDQKKGQYNAQLNEHISQKINYTNL